MFETHFMYLSIQFIGTLLSRLWYLTAFGVQGNLVSRADVNLFVHVHYGYGVRVLY